MRVIYRYILSVFFCAALISPMGLRAAANQDEHRGQEKREERHDRRYYDREHNDYHNWDEREVNAYRRWQQETRERREFGKLDHKRQAEYWRWRHEHPDNDRDRH